jgi:hypothetical protein
VTLGSDLSTQPDRALAEQVVSDSSAAVIVRYFGFESYRPELAVLREPVSSIISLISGKNTGNFAKHEGGLSDLTALFGADFKDLRVNSLNDLTGISSELTGIEIMTGKETTTFGLRDTNAR